MTSGADLQITGSSNTGSPVVDSAFTITYQIKNVGPDTAFNVVFTDTLAGGAWTGSSTSDIGVNCVPAVSTISCTIASLRKGAQVSVSVIITAPSSAGAWSTTGTVTSTVPDPLPANNAATVTVNVVNAPAATGGGGGSGGGGKVPPVIVSTFSTLPAVFNGGGYNITGSGTAPGFQFTALQTGTWNGVFASLHGQGLAGRGVCWLLSDDANNPDNPGAFIGQTASNAIPATGGTLTFFAAPQTTTPIVLVAGQKYWLFCRGLSNQVWGGLWDFSASNTQQSLIAEGSGTLAFADGVGRWPAFQVNVAQ